MEAYKDRPLCLISRFFNSRERVRITRKYVEYAQKWVQNSKRARFPFSKYYIAEPSVIANIMCIVYYCYQF